MFTKLSSVNGNTVELVVTFQPNSGTHEPSLATLEYTLIDNDRGVHHTERRIVIATAGMIETPLSTTSYPVVSVHENRSIIESMWDAAHRVYTYMFGFEQQLPIDVDQR